MRLGVRMLLTFLGAPALALAAAPAAAGLLGGLLGGGGGGSSSCGDGSTAPACVGAFSAPFDEPTIDGVPTAEKCVSDGEGGLSCKPAAGTLIGLHDGRYLYFNALEGTENVEFSIVAEFGQQALNDQTRVLSLGAGDAPSWIQPTPVDGGANPDGSEPLAIVPLGVNTGTDGADGALFCADVAQLADGRILAVGGTDYYSEPGIEGFPFGVAELEGLRNARIFDPRTDSWTQTASMNFGRWYPTIVTLPTSDVFVASGVTKLLKPVYPEAPVQSGRNVVQTETYDAACATWEDNGALGQRSLPLFPRLHLLPDGRVLYNAGGQAFNPFGQAYDQALWNVVGAYDPATRAWSDVAYAGFPLQLDAVALDQISHALNPTNPAFVRTLLSTLLGATFTSPDQLLGTLGTLLGLAVDPDLVERVVGSGMRGSTFSVMLPLRPDVSGRYRRAEFLTAGGVLTGGAATNPGLYLATDASRIDSIDVANGSLTYGSRLTGRLNEPRWYSSGVLLPDGSVMAFSGGDRDGVVGPGLEFPVRHAERFDPATGKWTLMATPNRPRTYHNTAVLMPDGRVLVGGHAPITTAYLSNVDLSALGFAPNDGRDPSFEIYSPPYVFRSDRPVISNATASARKLDYGQTHNVTTPQASSIESVVLVRFTDTTHLVDADQRSVVLPIVGTGSNRVTVRIPDDPAVLPAGHYMLFINKGSLNRPGFPGDSISWENGVHGTPKPILAGGPGAGRADGAHPRGRA